MLVQFGFSPFKMKKAELIATLNSFLIEQYAAGRKVLLIIDEAQNLTLKVLEEIRLLSGIEATKEKVLRIILAGQPELNEKLDSPELVQLTQRVRLRFHLGALSRDDLRAYVRHRLDVAGAEGREIFAEDTFPEIARYSGGVPRLVNTLCDTAMMAAFNEDRDHVTLQDIAAAVTELQWTEFSRARQHAWPRSRRRRRHAGERTCAAAQSLEDRALDRRQGGRGTAPGARAARSIGRTPDNDLQIDSKYISRHHCQLITGSDGITRDRRSQQHQRHHAFAASACAAIRCATEMWFDLGQHEMLYVDEPRLRISPTHTTTCARVDRERGERRIRRRRSSGSDAARPADV